MVSLKEWLGDLLLGAGRGLWGGLQAVRQSMPAASGVLEGPGVEFQGPQTSTSLISAFSTRLELLMPAVLSGPRPHIERLQRGPGFGGFGP